jgi:hypothetical protein
MRYLPGTFDLVSPPSGLWASLLLPKIIYTQIPKHSSSGEKLTPIYSVSSRKLGYFLFNLLTSGIALTDTFATETFLKDFTEDLAQKCSGVRQDSGDPIAFVPRIVRHYKEHNVDPRTKTIVFSDSLDVERCLELKNWADRHGIGSSFGVGTFLTSILPRISIIRRMSYISYFFACPTLLFLSFRLSPSFHVPSLFSSLYLQALLLL